MHTLTSSQKLIFKLLVFVTYPLLFSGLAAMYFWNTWERGSKVLDDVHGRSLLYMTTAATETEFILCLLALAIAIWNAFENRIFQPRKAFSYGLAVALLFVAGLLTANTGGTYAGLQYALSWERTYSLAPIELSARMAVFYYMNIVIIANAILIISAFPTLLLQLRSARTKAS